jgi:hypothetical protein
LYLPNRLSLNGPVRRDGPIIDIAGVAKVQMPSNYYDQPVAQQQDLVNKIIANNWRKCAKPLSQTLAILLQSASPFTPSSAP